MGAVFHLAETFESMGACITCGVTICAPSHLRTQRLRDHTNFFCVNGHSQHFTGKTPEQELRDELEQQKRFTEGARADAQRAREARDAADRRAAAARGQVTRIKNRVGNGVCPCCNRSFQNVRRHMETKHPGYAHEPAEGPKP